MDTIHPATFRDRVLPFTAGLIAFIVAAILTFIFGCLGVISFYEHKLIREWPVVAAIVEESRTTPQPSGLTKFAIRYHYNVGGQEFHSNRYDMSTVISGKPADQSYLVNQYPVGSLIHVHVNPDHPGDAFVNANPVSWGFALPSLLGLLFVYIGASLMWRSATAFCIMTRGPSSPQTGIIFYFFDSLEAAQKAYEWKSLPQEIAATSDRRNAFLTALLFAVIGIAGLLLLIFNYHKLDGIFLAFGCIMMPLFTIVGLCAMWRSYRAKYVLDQTGGLGREEISFYDSQEELLKAEPLRNQLQHSDKQSPR